MITVCTCAPAWRSCDMGVRRIF